MGTSRAPWPMWQRREPSWTTTSRFDWTEDAREDPRNKRLLINPCETGFSRFVSPCCWRTFIRAWRGKRCRVTSVRRCGFLILQFAVSRRILVTRVIDAEDACVTQLPATTLLCLLCLAAEHYWCAAIWLWQYPLRSDLAIPRPKPAVDNIIARFSDVLKTVHLYNVLNTSLRLQDQNAL